MSKGLVSSAEKPKTSSSDFPEFRSSLHFKHRKRVAFLGWSSWRSPQHDKAPHQLILSHKFTLQIFFGKCLPKQILHPMKWRHNMQTLQEGTWVQGCQARSAASLALVRVHQPCLFYTFSLLLMNKKKQWPKRGEQGSSTGGAVAAAKHPRTLH